MERLSGMLPDSLSSHVRLFAILAPRLWTSPGVGIPQPETKKNERRSRRSSTQSTW